MIEGLEKVLENGQIAIFPTDTIYGIGCKISDKAAIKRLYQIKKREENKPSLILVSSFKMAQRYGHFEKKNEEFVKQFWPGPLTVVVPATEGVPPEILGTGKTIAIRVPDQPFLIEAISLLNEAILAPSANFAGEQPPTKADEIDSRLTPLVDYVLDLAQVSGKELSGEASTIVDLSGNGFKIVREGTVPREKIDQAFELARRN